MVLLSFPFVPFALALGLLAALLVLELGALLVGGSIFGAGEGGIEADAGALAGSFDLDPGEVPDLAALTEASAALNDPGEGPGAGPVGGLGGFLGLGHTPFMIWFAALLLGFGVSGLALQSLVAALFGAPLPGPMAAGMALPAGLAFARFFGRFFARLLPTIETSATSTQFLGGLRGVVSQGTARAGVPAEVRLRDRHGNIHYPRCEPFSDEDVIPEGTEVLTVRERLGEGRWALRILAIA